VEKIATVEGHQAAEMIPAATLRRANLKTMLSVTIPTKRVVQIASSPLPTRHAGLALVLVIWPKSVREHRATALQTSMSLMVRAVPVATKLDSPVLAVNVQAVTINVEPSWAPYWGATTPTPATILLARSGVHPPNYHQTHAVACNKTSSTVLLAMVTANVATGNVLDPQLAVKSSPG
jgi:hypothetical protein